MRNQESIISTFACQICNQSLKLDCKIIFKILKYLFDAKSLVDLVWTDNTFGHVVWKMASYNRLTEDSAKDFLNPYNLVYHLKKAYECEFIKVKSSFF